MRSIFPSRTFGDLCSDVSYGYTASANTEPVGPQFLRITDIVPESLDWRRVPYCRIEDGDADRCQLLAGDIVVARTGATVGYAKYLADPPRSVFASYLVRFRVASQFDPRYVGYVVTSEDYKTFVRANSAGAAQPSASAKVLGSYEVPIPPLAQQRKIASVLSAYDDLIENNTRRIQILEEMAQTIYREWFVNFRYPGHEDVPLVDSELGPIPDGWAVRSFSELATFFNGYAFKPTDWGAQGNPIVKIKELKAGVTADTPRFAGALNSKYEIHDGDLLFSWSADLDSYLWADGPAWLNQHLFKVSPFEVSTLWLYHALCSRMGEFRLRSQGTTMKHIKRSALDEVRTCKPPRPLVDAFTVSVEPLDLLRLNLIRATRALRSTRDLLLPRLISGEVDVSELDIDVGELVS